MQNNRYHGQLVFGLDIGTRSIVGTVGYKENENDFKVVAQFIKEHETRAMLDGQIHDIPMVARTVAIVKEQLEEQLGIPLTDVCIAAAGRVLKTVTARADMEFQTEVVITSEHIYSLNSLGVEKAYEEIRKENKVKDFSFYCVGYTVVHYYMNDYMITNLEGHKVTKISTELIATFLPQDVIDGLYMAVELAGLHVANLTLEPIAAIDVAIPEKFRLLNIALVDVGAGTSDISVTKDGSIVAYGMIPYAGDELTECLIHKYLVEFKQAERMKQACIGDQMVSYEDIMGLTYEISAEEIRNTMQDAINKITKEVAERIIELNGGKSVNAVFVVGGGGKVPGFVSCLAEYLQLPYERVALRGEEVLKEVEFLQGDIKKDPLLVTPIGICLNFYDQANNFIFVTVNKQCVKLYDNNKLTIVDAALQIGYPNEKLFPRRGKSIEFTVNGNKRLIRGELGEAAIVRLNEKEVGISATIAQHDVIQIIESTIGTDAQYEVGQIPEYNEKGTINFIFNNQQIDCPKFVVVNDQLVSEYYQIQDGDKIEILNYYTLEQVLEFMDLEYEGAIQVNHIKASLNEKIYENFTIDCEIKENEREIQTVSKEETIGEKAKIITKDITSISVFVNERIVQLTGKKAYIFVDILDFYPFDTSIAGGKKLILQVNRETATFSTTIQDGDKIELYWEE